MPDRRKLRWTGDRRGGPPVTATTDFLAADIFDRCGRVVPAPSDALQSTLATILADGRHLAEGRHRRTVTASVAHHHRDTVRAINEGKSAFVAKSDVRWKRRNFATHFGHGPDDRLRPLAHVKPSHHLYNFTISWP